MSSCGEAVARDYRAATADELAHLGALLEEWQAHRVKDYA
jgi:hypothetical protein